MSGKSKAQQPRTKGNVKPSSSEKAAKFLLQQTGGLGGFDILNLTAGGGSVGLSTTDASETIGGDSSLLPSFVPIDQDPEAQKIDPDIRMQLRKLDKRDAVTKQKALGDLCALLETKSEECAMSALPYWPRIYSRLTLDGDKKVRELAQKALSGFTQRCGRNIAPYLKQLLPSWIMAQCDPFEPAADAAERCFEATFPPHKHKEVYLRCWKQLLDQIEETLKSPWVSTSLKGKQEGGDSVLIESLESTQARSLVSCLRTLTRLLPFLADDGNASERVANLLREKNFWRYANKSEQQLSPSILVAYYQLITAACSAIPTIVQGTPAIGVAFCELTLRRVDETSPACVLLLWEALLSCLKCLEADSVWKLVSFPKVFLPKLNNLLENGGNGCARQIFPRLLPLLSQLPLSVANEKDCHILKQLLDKTWEGLHRPRVTASVTESGAVASALIDCCWFLVKQAIESGCPNMAKDFLLHPMALLEECLLERTKARNAYIEQVLPQLCLVFAFLSKQDPEYVQFITKCSVTCVGRYASEPTFCANLVTFIFVLKDTGTKSDMKQLISGVEEVIENSEEKRILEPWRLDLLIALRDSLEGKSCANNHWVMPYCCLMALIPEDVNSTASTEESRRSTLNLCSTLLEADEENNLPASLQTLTLCRMMAEGIIHLVVDLPNPEQALIDFVENLNGRQKILFLNKLFPSFVRLSSRKDEKILRALEQIVLILSDRLLRDVFTNWNFEEVEQLKALLNAVFATNLVADKFIEKVANFCDVGCDGFPALYKLAEQRSQRAEILMHFVDCLGSCRVPDHLVNMEIIVRHLTGLYFTYLLEGVRCEIEDDGGVKRTAVWTRVAGLPLTFIQSASSLSPELTRDFVRSVLDLLIENFVVSAAGESLDALKDFGRSFLNAVKLNQSIHNYLIQHWFAIIDRKLAALATIVNDNTPFDCQLSHLDQLAFSELVRILAFTYPFIADPTTYEIGDCVPDYWVPFAAVASLMSEEIMDNSVIDLYDSLRAYIADDLCQNFTNSVLNTLLALAVGDFSSSSIVRVSYSVENITIFRAALLFCMPSRASQWPEQLRCSVTRWLEDLWFKCDKEQFALIRDVYIQAGLSARCFVQEAVVATVRAGVRNPPEPDDNEVKTRALELISTFVRHDSGYFFHLFPLVMEIKNGAENLVIDSEEDLANADWLKQKLRPTLALVSIMRSGIHLCPGEIKDDQWDFMLCTSVAWTSLLSKMAMDTPDRASFGYHICRLIAVLESSLSVVEGRTVVQDWENFFSVHIFECLLPLFVDRFYDKESVGPRIRSEVFLCESLCSAVATCPLKSLMHNQLSSPKLLADDPVQLPIPVATLVNTLCPLLFSSYQSVQLTAFSCLATMSRELPKLILEADNVEDEDILPIKMPLSIVECMDRLAATDLRSVPWGTLSPVVRNPTESIHTQLLGSLLIWEIILNMLAACPTESKARFDAWLTSAKLQHNSYFDNLMESIGRLIPPNPTVTIRNSLKTARSSTNGHRKLIAQINLMEEEPRLFTALTDARSASQLHHIACHLFRRVLQTAPAVARRWYVGQSKGPAGVCCKFVEKYVSPHLTRMQIEEVNQKLGKSGAAPGEKGTVVDDSLEVRGRPAAREVLAIYRLTDELTLEMIIGLPSNYPLGQVTVETGRKVGVSTQQWRAWLLQMTSFLQNQNGSILEGINLWKRNLEQKFAGLEDCMICFSVIHGTTFSLPKKQCRVCKKRFHAACMYKWFTSSQNPTCPLCRNLFYDPGAGWRGKERET